MARMLTKQTILVLASRYLSNICGIRSTRSVARLGGCCRLMPKAVTGGLFDTGWPQNSAPSKAWVVTLGLPQRIQRGAILSCWTRYPDFESRKAGHRDNAWEVKGSLKSRGESYLQAKADRACGVAEKPPDGCFDSRLNSMRQGWLIQAPYHRRKTTAAVTCSSAFSLLSTCCCNPSLPSLVIKYQQTRHRL